MNQMIKIDGDEYGVEHRHELTDYWVRNGELVELRKDEFFSTKKHFVKMVLGLSRIFPFRKRINFYLLAFRIQFTNIYEIWMRLKYPNSVHL